jgi:predicted SAM-dependent methyltransferase
MKLNLGAGNDIRAGYINHDIAELSGIDLTHNLDHYPWPWPKNSFDEILAMDILEHLDNFVSAMEELHRILKPGGVVMIRVPYWNHSCAYIDPTHKRGFHEKTFHFFDIDSNYYKDRYYYSNVAFKIIDEVFVITPGDPYFHIPKLGIIHLRQPLIKKVVGWFGNHVSNVIADVQVVMKKV